MYTAPGHSQALPAIGNDVHDRGQGYVCLRALGTGPPASRER
ncbi:MAG TPA: hypothetical protein VF212_08060 [Longimicrobiales bacterium]